MKKNYIILFLTFALFYLPTAAQELKNIDSLYSNYFENTREIPFLHLNKTSFISGEEIWFQAYVLEQNSNKLHPTTSNLYVSVFDDQGILKQQQLVNIKNGIGNGNIAIDSSFPSGSYYIKASTNWMRNFKEDNAYTQKIKVVSSEKKEITNKSSQKNYFDFQLFPEGGHLIADAKNSIGLLIKDIDNNGVKIKKGVIKNRKGEIIGQFSNNDFGLSVKNIFVPKNEILTFEATLPSGKIIEKQTPFPKENGITINVKRFKEHFILNIITNKTSLKVLNSKKYRIFVHNTRSFKNLYFTFNKKSTNYLLGLNKKDLPNGINIITVFNENNTPVLERLIYNEFNEDISEKINTNILKTTTDSLFVSISNNSNQKIKISTSFLPLKSKANNSKHTIKSAVLLKPYIKGNIENVSYYFTNNTNRLKNLDALLLTQGWSKYDWNSIFNSPPKTNFNFKNGIDITVKFNQSIKPEQTVLVFSGDNNIIKNIKPTNNTFILKNTFVKKNTNIEFTLREKNRKYKITPALSYSRNRIYDVLNLDITDKKEMIELEPSKFKNYYNNVIVLDEVVVKTKTKYDNEVKGLASSFRFREPKDIMFPGTVLSDYISFFAGEKSYTNNPLTGVFLNNELITKDYLYSPLFDIDLEEVRGVAYGQAPGGGTLLYIYSYSRDELRKLNINSKFSRVNINVGFASAKEYYTPKYPSYSNEVYINYGAIFWKPNISIDSNNSMEFSIPRNNQKEMKLFIEGITSKGNLISTQKIIATQLKI